MAIATVYKITNKVSGKCYIGVTNDLTQRRHRHKEDAFKKGSQLPLHRAIRAYGWEQFEFEPIYQSLDDNHARNEMERCFISEYQSLASQNGYNLTLGGEGCPGFKMPRDKVGRSGKGRVWSKAMKQHFSEVQKGYVASSVARTKISAARKGNIPWNKGKETGGSVKQYVFEKDGQQITITNLKKWCRDNQLSYGSFRMLSEGHRARMHGYTLVNKQRVY